MNVDQFSKARWSSLLQRATAQNLLIYPLLTTRFRASIIHTFTVESGSHPGMEYVVALRYEEERVAFSCTCQAGYFNAACRHAALALKFDDAWDIVDELPDPPEQPVPNQSPE